MVLSVGTDIVDIERIEGALARSGALFAERILTPSELSEWHRRNSTPAFLARRFAAKEAIAKALGTGIGHGVSFQDMVIDNDDRGAPIATLLGGAAEALSARGASRVLVRLSDEQRYAIAYAVAIA